MSPTVITLSVLRTVFDKNYENSDTNSEYGPGGCYTIIELAVKFSWLEVRVIIKFGSGVDY